MGRSEDQKRNWIATMRCVVTKTVTLEDCTEEQALNNPWDHSVDEQESDQRDWDIERLEPQP